MHSRILPLLIAALALTAPTAAAQTEQETAQTRMLAWTIEPGDVRDHTVTLDLETRLTAITGRERTERQTNTALSFLVTTFGLRRAPPEHDGASLDTVIELTVDDLHLDLTTQSGASAVTVTMDDEGMTVRHGNERPSHVPWADMPPDHGGEIGELLGRPVACTISRHGTAVRIDGRMIPWTQVLDSIDLIPLIMPLVPVPDDEVDAGSKWTIAGERSVTLSQPWGELDLATRAEVTVAAFEQHDGADAARLAFTCTADLAKARPRLDYALEISGELLVGFDGAVLGGTATVALEAKTTLVDTDYELTGTGTLRFNAPETSASHTDE